MVELAILAKSGKFDYLVIESSGTFYLFLAAEGSTLTD